MSLLVFMYHRILPEPHPEAVCTDLFRRQLDYLQSKFRVLSPEETVAYLRGGTLPSGKNARPFAALTFDDGWTDNLLYADPILKERGLSAMMAVSAGYLHDGPVRETEDPGILFRSSSEAAQSASNGDLRNYLSTPELKTMSDSGRWLLAAHGTRHFLGCRGKSILCAPQEDPAETFEKKLREDILNCREKLDRLTGRTGRVFFWPYGHYSTRAAGIVKECGYDLQFSVYKGSCRADDPRLVLPRIGVSRWKKFRKNCIVFRNPVLSFLRSFFSSEQVCFDDFYGGAE